MSIIVHIKNSATQPIGYIHGRRKRIEYENAFGPPKWYPTWSGTNLALDWTDIYRYYIILVIPEF